MINTLLIYVAETLKLNNLYIDNYFVNCIQDKEGKILKDFRYNKEYAGLNDTKGNAFYIRYLSNIQFSQSDKRFSDENEIDVRIPLRLVFYSIAAKKRLNPVHIEQKLRNDLRLITFDTFNATTESNLKIEVKESNIFSENVIEKELNRKLNSGADVVCISIDFDLLYKDLPTSCFDCDFVYAELSDNACESEQFGSLGTFTSCTCGGDSCENCPTDEQIIEWDTAYSNSHTHSNKTVLDGITAILVNAWNGAVDWIVDNGANILASLFKVKVSAADTTGNYLENKLVDGINSEVIKANTGADETLQINVVAGNTLPGDLVSVGFLSQLTNAGRLYFHNDPSDILGYEYVKTEPGHLVEDSDVIAVKASDGEKLIGKYITPANYPSSTIIPAGIWNFDLWAKVDNPAGVTQLVVRAYIYSGGAEGAEIINWTSDELNGVVATRLLGSKILPADVVLSAGDRIVVKVFAKTTSVTDRTVTYYYEGTTHYSNITTNIPGAIFGVNIVSKTKANFEADTTTIYPYGVTLYETDTTNIKIGDGIRTYLNLPYKQNYSYPFNGVLKPAGTGTYYGCSGVDNGVKVIGICNRQNNTFVTYNSETFAQITSFAVPGAEQAVYCPANRTFYVTTYSSGIVYACNMITGTPTSISLGAGGTDTIEGIVYMAKGYVAAADLTNNKIYFIKTSDNSVPYNYTCVNGCNFLAYDSVNDLLYTAKATFLTRINTTDLTSITGTPYNILTGGIARGIAVDSVGSVYVNCQGYIHKVLYNGITVVASRVTIADGYHFALTYSAVDNRIRAIFMNYAGALYTTIVYCLDTSLSLKESPTPILTYYGYGLIEEAYAFYIIMNTGGSSEIFKHQICKI